MDGGDEDVEPLLELAPPFVMVEGVFVALPVRVGVDAPPRVGVETRSSTIVTRFGVGECAASSLAGVPTLLLTKEEEDEDEDEVMDGFNVGGGV